MAYSTQLKIAALASLIAASTAHAQSSVTLFGMIDTGITYFSNQSGHSNVIEDGYVNAPSMIGFTGREDLGGGNRAIFRLTQSFQSTNGKAMASGSAFGMESFVGLESDRYGTLTLGRQNDFMVEMLQYTGIVGPIYGYHPGDYDRITGEQLNNSVKYDSPEIAGIQGGAIYSFGSTSGNATNTGRAFGLKLKYHNGPFAIGAAMTDINGTTINPAGIGLAYAFGTSTASTASSGIELRNLTTSAIGAAYQMGPARFVASYSYVHFIALDGAKDRLQTGDVGVMYDIRPDLNVAADYGYSVGLGGRWHVYNAMINYFLSKRTTVYLDADFEHVTGAGQVAQLLYASPSSNSDQLALRVGISHKF
ncbi:Outer membrane protein OmpU [Paraburkholderia tropica]|uniref:porin n=1 Tax=Paraburkholderia tropica TaxID=92647 RepID=UPI001CB21F99|nr:porin [Paraburkholderia tropica]CAG9201757.1 Outer membrane protein OmpU [Paraburkholderia tropica]